MLRALAGLDVPDAGTIAVGDEVWLDRARGVIVPPQRRRIGLLSQEYALFPHLTVAANVAYGLIVRARDLGDPRVVRLCEVAQSDEFRAEVAGVPGYDVAGAGDIRYDA